MQIAEILHLTIAELGRAYRRRDLSPVEVVNALLERIRIADRHLNSFILVTAEEALNASREAERAFLKGEVSPLLLGVPVAVKDIPVNIARMVRHCGSAGVLPDIPNPGAPNFIARVRAGGAGAVPRSAGRCSGSGRRTPTATPT